MDKILSAAVSKAKHCWFLFCVSDEILEMHSLLTGISSSCFRDLYEAMEMKQWCMETWNAPVSFRF